MENQTPQQNPKYKSQYLVIVDGQEHSTPCLAIVRMLCTLYENVQVYKASSGPFGNGLKFYRQKKLEARLCGKV